MIKGFIRTGYDRVTLFGEGMKNADVLKCKARFALNEVDGADLTLPATNRPGRSLLQKNAVVELRNDSETVFIGEVAVVPRNELGDISFELDGALGFLSGVCKAPFTIKPTDPNGPVENFLTAIFNQYNAEVSPERQLQLGAVTVTGGVSMDHSDEFVNMLDLVREVREQLGGYLYVDYASGLPTVHYVATPTAKAARALELGENVLTVDDRLDFTNYASRVYATGSYYVTTTVDGKEKREQKPLNAGYVVDADMEALYGRRDLAYKSDTDMGGDKDNNVPDKTQAEATAIILAEAQAILDERKVPIRSLEMTATELARMGVDYRTYKVGTVAPAYIGILNIKTELVVRSVQPNYIDQGNSIVSFGREAATISGASFGGGSVSGGGSGGSGQVGPQGPAGPQGPQGVQGPQGPAGADGADGADGVSPTVTVTAITGGHRVTITDANGTSTFDVMDGSGSGSENVVAMSKVNGAWQLDSGMWRVLWNHFFDEIRLITTEGNDVRHLYKVGLSYTNSSSITSVDIYFSDQRYNGRTAEGRAFKFTVPETGNGTITEITAADIPTGGGGGSGSYIKFNINESTLAVTDSSGTAATGRMILNVCWSNSVVLYGTERTENSLKYNCYHLMEDDLADGEFVRFFRPTSDGIVVLKIGAAETTATKTVIPFGGGGFATGALMYSEDQTLTSTEQLRARRNAGLFSPAVGFLYSNGTLTSENGVQTGASIVSRYYPSVVADRAAMFAFDISSGKIYWLDSVNTATNTVVFKRTDTGVNTFLTVSGTSSTVTESTSSAETYVVSVSDNGSAANPRYTLASGITPASILEHINNIKLQQVNSYRLVTYGGSGGSWTVIFGGFEVNANGGLDAVTFRLTMTLNPSACTITKRSTTVSSSGGSSGGGNLIYDYVTSGNDHFVILRGAESPASGNAIVSMMASENAVPVVFVNTLCYYYHGQDSGSVIFRRIDNARKVEVDKTTGIATESAV